MSEIRVNRIVSADGSNAPQFPAGFSLATGMGITNSPNITGSAVTFSGLSQITNATDSTSTTTGSLVVTGGVGIAKNVYIGAGLSVAGTLTYEDVTNVDSVGLITAKSGLNVSGGEVTVGSALTIASVGVATFIGAAGVAVTITPSTGKVQATVFEGPLTGNVTGNASGSALNVTQAAQTAITSVGTLAGLTVGSAGEFKVGTAVTIASTSGVSTFAANVQFTGDAGKSCLWNKGNGAFELNDNARLKIGSGADLSIYHDATNSYIENTTGNLFLKGDNVNIRSSSNEQIIETSGNGAVSLYYDNSVKLATTNEGAQITGFTSTTAGLGVTGGMWEGAFIKAGKLTDNKTLGISTSNIFVFTTQESTTGTPNIIWNDSYALSSKMKVGDSVTITVITTAAAGGYCANWTIDGNAVSEQWNGGSAPSAGGDNGYDIYTHTLVRKATGTGDTGWLMFSNVSNFT